MDTKKVSDWVNLLASAGVLLGLLLVGLELRQNNELAEAESVRELWNQNLAILQFELESDLLPLYAKAVEDPESLTNEEIERLDTYLEMFVSHQINVATMREDYGLAQSTTEAQAAGMVDDMLGSRFARGWYAESEYWIAEWHPRLNDAIKREMEKQPVMQSYTWPEQLRQATLPIEE